MEWVVGLQLCLLGRELALVSYSVIFLIPSWCCLGYRGVSKIRLIDFDYVTLSSLNRHATAGLMDVGTPKVKCIEKTLKQLSRWVEVDCRVELWRKDEDGTRMLEDADWVIGEPGLIGIPHLFASDLNGGTIKDAIDNITTKVDLLKYCHDNFIKVSLSPCSLTISPIQHLRSSPPWVPEPNAIPLEFKSPTSLPQSTTLSHEVSGVVSVSKVYLQESQ